MILSYFGLLLVVGGLGACLVYSRVEESEHVGDVVVGMCC